MLLLFPALQFHPVICFCVVRLLAVFWLLPVYFFTACYLLSTIPCVRSPKCLWLLWLATVNSKKGKSMSIISSCMFLWEWNYNCLWFIVWTPNCVFRHVLDCAWYCPVEEPIVSLVWLHNDNRWGNTLIEQRFLQIRHHSRKCCSYWNQHDLRNNSTDMLLSKWIRRINWKKMVQQGWFHYGCL